LAEKFRADDQLGWETTAYLGDQATKARLAQLLGGDQTPALLFAASHGNALSLNNPRQRCHQGALICCDWPGAEEWAGRGPIPQDFYFAGDDLDSGANLLGLIGFFFACFGAGTPLQDEFAKRFLKDQRQDIAPYPFLAQLPVRMLGHPRGGALAVIGHVERAWPTSFRWSGGAGPQIEVFESTLRRLLAGHPVGSAVEYFNERYAELAVMLSDELEEIEFQKQYVPGELATLWTANNDARGYAIIGDPAVRLPVVEDGTDQVRSPIEPVGIAGSPAKDARPQSEICPPEASAAAASTAARSGRAVSSASLLDRQAEAALDQLFSFSPLPTVPPDYKQEHPELYQAWVDHIKAGYKNNDEVFQQVLKAFMRSHDATVMMYWILFGLGVSAFVAAIVLGLVRESVVYSLVFGGLSVVSFVTYFIGRSTQAVEENLQFITWLGIIYNSYWTHLAWAFDAETAGETLDKATTDAVQQLRQLIDRHAEATRKRPGLGREQPNQTGATNGRQSDEQASTNGMEGV
ncbi:MAG TPA: hypothetical protein VF177_16710, partial [Anaerolineae bacterium]